MNNVHFSSKTDEWSTPQAFFDKLNEEFKFTVDAAANEENKKCDRWIEDAETFNPEDGTAIWCNPPYSKLRDFLGYAAKWRDSGATVVLLIPSRTDTKAFHQWIWDEEFHQPRLGVQLRFIKGRLKFGGSKNSAPFPSAVIVFRPIKN